VCATTLPQRVLPRVMGDPRYYPHLDERVRAYARRAERAVEVLSAIPEITIHPARGAFYMTAVFRRGALSPNQTLAAPNRASEIIAPHLGSALDQRFVLHLLAATGICVVPLSTGFNSDLQGFRFTLLESDPARFETLLADLATALVAYLGSSTPTLDSTSSETVAA